MKQLKTFLVGVLAVFGSQFCVAQSSIKIGVGDSSVGEAALSLGNAFSDIFSGIFGLKSESSTTVKVPYVFADYRYALSDVVGIGGQVGYTKYESTNVYDNGDFRKAGFSIFTIMPGVDVRYFQRNNFKLYGNANLGVAFVSGKSETNGVAGNDNQEANFIFQVNPIGISYGGKVSGFLEAGFGLSLFNAGVKFEL